MGMSAFSETRTRDSAGRPVSGFIPRPKTLSSFCIIGDIVSRRRVGLRAWGLAALLAGSLPLVGQVIQFRSNGLDYQVLTRSGLTLMYARMPLRTSRYSLLQVAISNGSRETWKIEAADFAFEYEDGTVVRAVSEQQVVGEFFRNAGRAELVKLQAAYEKALYNNQRIRPNNGYEKRRQSALVLGSKGLKAAAAAAAIAFVSGKVAPGDSTDGALFFPTVGRDLGPGRIVATVDGESFEFLTE